MANCVQIFNEQKECEIKELNVKNDHVPLTSLSTRPNPSQTTKMG